MGRDEALQTIMSLAAQGLVSLTDHALYEKMAPMGLEYDDVIRCLTQPTSIQQSDPYHHASDWMVTGPDLSGNTFTVCVIIEANLLVITVF